jgi:hypothetical protein
MKTFHIQILGHLRNSYEAENEMDALLFACSDAAEKAPDCRVFHCAISTEGSPEILGDGNDYTITIVPTVDVAGG